MGTIKESKEITLEEYNRAKKIIHQYESQSIIYNLEEDKISVCKLNRNPSECSVNLYTKTGCNTCHYFNKSESK